MNIFDKIGSKWDTFIYNYSWSYWIGYIDGWIPKLSFTVPLVAYLLLFNDYVVQNLEFSTMLSPETLNDGLNSSERLRFIYFGLIFLGISNFIFRVTKPKFLNYGTNLIDYTKTCIDTFTFERFLNLHREIKDSIHITLEGKYDTERWNEFEKIAVNKEGIYDLNVETADWEKAKLKYGSLLRSILYEIYFRRNIQKRHWLTLCVFLSTFGYILLLIPSFDIFIRITKSTFF